MDSNPPPKKLTKKLITSKDQNHALSLLRPFYESKLIPPEKKPYLSKLSASEGPYLAIENGGSSPHYLLDASSQIATLGYGLNPRSFFGTAHHQAAWTNRAYDEEFLKLLNRYKEFFKRKLGVQKLNLTLANSGAEANEIALGMAYHKRSRKEAKKILAFEGSFHGRMLLSLYSTWNPSKREPFQWQGKETLFLPYPELEGDDIHPPLPKDWCSFWSRETQENPPSSWLEEKRAKEAHEERDHQNLKREIHCLMALKKALRSGEIFALIIEPMQCEGGDRYSSERFHLALLLLAKLYDVSVIYDEVQTGFHLGREFFWHSQFNLSSQERQWRPDYIVCAKKAQVGLVLSFDQEAFMPYCDQQFQGASVIRGYIHALGLDQSQSMIHALERKVKPKLKELIHKFSKYLERPRSQAMAFAFDLKDPSKIGDFVAKRFDFGLLYYPAGRKTLRFRLNILYQEADLNFLFEQLHKICALVFEKKTPGQISKYRPQKKHTPYRRWNLWHQKLVAHKKGYRIGPIDDFIEKELEHLSRSVKKDLELTLINQHNFPLFEEDIENLQREIYEPSRQTDIATFEKTARNEHSVCYGLKIDDDLAGIVFAGPLELYPLERGLRIDPDFHNENCLYMIDTTIHHKYQNFGLGRFLKFALTLKAQETHHTAIKGRNRDRLAAGMLKINLSLGAFEENYLFEDYPDFASHRDVLYYRQPLQWKREKEKTPFIDLGGRLNNHHDGIETTEEFIFQQIPNMVNKLCLSNFVDENFLQQLKEISQLMPPKLRHLYTTSGQSECVDKIAKSLLRNAHQEFERNSFFITFEGHEFGKGSQLARELSDYHFRGVPPREDDLIFPLKRLPHPTRKRASELLFQCEELLAQNSSSCKGIWIEPVRQRDYALSDLSFLRALKALATKYQCPLIFNETASQEYTAHEGHFFLSSLKELTPDAAMVFAGGQMGLCFLSKKYYVDQPLMMISTWDGDQFALKNYSDAVSFIVKNKDDFLKTRKDFHQRMSDQLPFFLPSQGRHQERAQARGIIPPPFDLSFAPFLRKTSHGYLLDPSYGAMKSFLHNNFPTSKNSPK